MKKYFLLVGLNLFLVNNAFAVTKVISQNESMTSDWNYSNNNTFGATGILGSVGSYVVETNGYNMVANNNSNGLGTWGGGTRILNINGTGSNSITVNDNKSASFGNGIGILSQDSNSQLNINNMDIEAIGNTNGGIVSNHGASIRISSDTSNNIVVSDSRYALGLGLDRVNSTAFFSITNMNIFLSNSVYAAIGGYSGVMDIKGDGHKLHANNSGEDGIYAYLATLTITGMDIETKNNTAGGIVAYETSIFTIKNSDIVSENNGKNIYVETNGNLKIFSDKPNKNIITINNSGNGAGIAVDGKAEINNMIINSTDNSISIVSNDGELDIINTYINNDVSYAAFITDGNALINIEGSEIDNSKTLWLAQGSGSAVINSDSSLLAGKIEINSGAATELKLQNNSIWKMIDTSRVGYLNIDNSMVDLRSESNSYNSLVVGSYEAVNSILYINTFFDSVGLSTDKLVVNGGDALGNTTLHVTSTGTDGANSQINPNGIMVVDLTNAATKTAGFSLYGGVVDSGAWEYELHKGLDNNWYLQSNGTPTNTSNAIANVPALHIHIIKTGMNELRKRLGELRENNPNSKSGLWLRNYNRSLKVDEHIDSKMNIYGLEGGYDYQIYSNCEDKIYAGLMAGYSYTDNIKIRNTRTLNGKGHANTPTIGAYMTWLNKNGWFIDTTIRNFWSNMDITMYSSQNIPISFTADRRFITGSIEGGKRFSWNIDNYSYYILEPKLELGYAYAEAKSFRTSTNNKIYYGSSDSILGRASVMGGYNKYLDNGSVIEPFLQIGILQEFGGTTDIAYAGGNYKSDISGTSLEIGGGLNAKINNSWNVYSDIMYETGRVIDSISSNIGVRFNF